jgi:diaminobutyrate-2-oxoglutarate transaminase
MSRELTTEVRHRACTESAERSDAAVRVRTPAASPPSVPRSDATCRDVSLRTPRQRDGAAVWALARRSGALDANSAYVYLMWCDRFAETSVVAERDGDVVGFTCAFVSPGTLDVLFVWQIAVDGRVRGRRIARRMLEHIVRRTPAVRFVEATVTPSNGDSRRLFQSLARRFGCACDDTPCLDSGDFPADAPHEPERLLRVGPLRESPPRQDEESPFRNEEATMEIFETLESEVRSYVRSFPAVFGRARGHLLYDEGGRAYIDFFAGAGALNYGHNDPRLKRRLVEYLRGDGIVHSLDMATSAKRTFMERMRDVVLVPRKLSYKMMFPGPTGTNCIEAALKLARKATGRTTVFGFDGGFHGMTLGALSITANARKRAGAGVALDHARLLPYCGETRKGQSSLRILEQTLEASAADGALPAAVVLETVQCEGGVRVASDTWLRGVAAACARHGVLLVVDDIQAGCGRTGSFLSFESAGLRPDIVCLSKSLSGFGLPLSLVLLREHLDVFEPGEHNGTFRGHNPAFVTAAEALRYWEDGALAADVLRRAAIVRERLTKLAAAHPEAKATVRGRGLVQGLVMPVEGLASTVARECFARGLLIETAGPKDEVLKLMPPLTIEDAALSRGLAIVGESLAAAIDRCDRDAAA